MKAALAEHLRTLGYDIEDLGPLELVSTDDYPDYVTPLANRVAAEENVVGIILAGSGEGEAMCANRVSGVRAAVFYGPMKGVETLDIEGGKSEDGFDIVRLARKHNNANVLSVGSRFVAGSEVDKAVRIFLETSFSEDPRHGRRLGKF